jgi:hypothetical protein
MDPTTSSLRRIVEMATGLPEYEQMMQYFNVVGKPDLKAVPMRSAEYGAFYAPGVADKYTRPTIELDEFYAAAQPRGMVSTLLHEMAHGADNKMISAAYGKDRGGKQFKDAYTKLGTEEARREGVEKIVNTKTPAGKSSVYNKQWVDRNADYRSSGPELPAFAVGGMASPYKPVDPVGYEAPAHVNATMATEFAILLDLALRDATARKAAGQRIP